MSFLTKTTHFALSYLPENIKTLVRSSLPISIKRSLGEGIMKEVVNNSSIVTVNDGRKFNVIEDRLFLRVVYEKNYEPFLTSIASKLIQEGDNIVDVGANFGWYTTLFCKNSKTGKIVCYEPAPHSYNILEKNIKLNNMGSCINIRKVGVGEKAGTFLMDPGSSSESGLAHVVTSNNEYSIEVPVVALDEDLADSIGKIDYMKLDIEGFEYFALKGAKSILSASDQPILQIELNDEALLRSGSSRKETVRYLKDLGYSFYEVIPNSPGYLQLSNTDSCSDVFCFGDGKNALRLKELLHS